MRRQRKSGDEGAPRAAAGRTALGGPAAAPGAADDAVAVSRATGAEGGAWLGLRGGRMLAIGELGMRVQEAQGTHQGIGGQPGEGY